MDLLLDANREKFKLLGSQYTEHLEAVLALQGTLIEDILPSVTDELELDVESQRWAKEWLSDTCTLFRVLRRNKFTRSFALESIRKTLVWRFTHLWPPDPSPMRFVHCLPSPARDPFGRPILVVKVVSFNDSSDAYKPLIIQGLESLRLHLKRLNDDTQQSLPTLQYVILLDLKNLSTQSLNIDLVTWTLREAIPRFPGLLAAAFMINYSWAHAGIWSIAKRVLPAPAISRVFFPTQQELTNYFSLSMLPKDYGGTLASLTELNDPLWNDPPSVELGASGQPSAPLIIPVAQPPSITAIPPTSLLNPFFGYPVSSSGGSPSLHHGRRRKRDLARTLLILAWRRWRRHIMTCVWILVFILTVKGRRTWFIRSSQAAQPIWRVMCDSTAFL
ncbi:CRAL-TRIO domain-containing protein [Mycena alexandri]|uniref:CRAL-TRIO domain-containing protein n=1 Tax=Mycena alexandri TaxID=1745969 RepID=A0AAD6WP32_9AGAR|nr:CRAL-TRIO domain-containing protein [Mycena alexandri]